METPLIELTNEQAQALEATKGPVQVLNPHTQQKFFLISQEVYDLVRKVVEGPNRRGWDDPELDVYEQFRKKP